MFDIEHLKKISNDILAVCINEPETGIWLGKQYKCTYHSIPFKPEEERTGKFHPLCCPQDWAIDNVDEIYTKIQLLEAYADYLILKYGTGPYSFDFHNKSYVDEILPHWVIFPHYPERTMGWRQGEAEVYMGLYMAYRESLSDEEREEWDKKYPEPDYFDFKVIE
jgi:hypothetical protein